MSANATVTVGERVEIGRYTARGRKRVIYGQRINGVVRLTDRPLHGTGRSYLIESGLEQDGYAALNALIADYVTQAWVHDQVPMAMSTLRARYSAEAAS
jgi:hypothetical protein